MDRGSSFFVDDLHLPGYVLPSAWRPLVVLPLIGGADGRLVDGCCRDGLHAAAYIASGIHQVTAYGAVKEVHAVQLRLVRAVFRAASHHYSASLRGCCRWIVAWPRASPATASACEACIVLVVWAYSRLARRQSSSGFCTYAHCLDRRPIRFDDKKCPSLAVPGCRTPAMVLGYGSKVLTLPHCNLRSFKSWPGYSFKAAMFTISDGPFLISGWASFVPFLSFLASRCHAIHGMSRVMYI